MVTPTERRRFDQLLDDIVGGLPDHLHEMLEEVPLIIEDEPSRRLFDELGMDPRGTDLCGLHSGVPLTQRSVEHITRLPDRMMMFRGPILRVAGRNRDELERQIRITLLHEIGHHFGLDEDQLAELGYG